MADRGAIENTLASWALGYDQREVERMRRCFTPDAELVLDVAGGERLGPYIGLDAVMGHFTEHHDVQTDQRRHLTTNVVIDEETDDTASVVSCLTLLVTQDNVIRLQASGLYRDRFVRTGAGWQIRERRIELDIHF